MMGNDFRAWHAGWEQAREFYRPKADREFRNGARVLTESDLVEWAAPGSRRAGTAAVVVDFDTFYDPKPYRVEYEDGGSGFFAGDELTRLV